MSHRGNLRDGSQSHHPKRAALTEPQIARAAPLRFRVSSPAGATRAGPGSAELFNIADIESRLPL
jgi:hypothetical protein